MATVFMKWLETNPQRYDRGLRLLTLGRLQLLKEQILQDYVQAGVRVLEIGCGTGELALMMAEQGAVVTGIDASPAMLSLAQERISEQDLARQVTLHYMDATLVGERFQAETFDLIVSTLVFSELPTEQQEYVLQALAGLLAPGGMILIADEVVPKKAFPRLAYHLVHWPLALLTWLLTRATTNPLWNFDLLLAQAGFEVAITASHLMGSLVLYEISLRSEARKISKLPPFVYQLQHQNSLRTILLDLWTLFFRIIPPIPKSGLDYMH
jgi:demethylmenaquinone methyltransferase/2-methoxy-6-polyprenyl-1,4-benzoquinol methylase